MKTFFNILQKIIDIKKSVYPDEGFTIWSFNNYKPEYTYIMYLINLIVTNEKTSKLSHPIQRNSEVKFMALSYFLNNIFLTNEYKEKFFTIFSKAQKTYFAFVKLSNLYRYKKYKLIVDTDLTLNPLNPFDKNTFILIQNKSKYLFSIRDLVTIIDTAIGNAPDFFLVPLLPKNPYNNQILNVTELCNIYFKMKYSTRLPSLLFHCFFLEEFCKHKFIENHEPIIREYAIKRYVFKSPYTVLYESTILMIKHNPCTSLLNIHRDFPKESLVEIFRPFLYYYFVINYGVIGTEKITTYKHKLHNKLTQFYKYNKSFGRKIVKVIKNNNTIVKREINFISEHISFYKIKSVFFSEDCSENNMLNRNRTNNIIFNNDNIFLPQNNHTYFHTGGYEFEYHYSYDDDEMDVTGETDETDEIDLTDETDETDEMDATDVPYEEIHDADSFS
jgi:hypothetical protein